MADEADSKEIGSIDDLYCNLAYYFQKELGITLDNDYPVARFNILKEEAILEGKKLKKEKKKSLSSKGLMK